LGVYPDEFATYDWIGRTGKSDRAAIRQRLGFRPVREEDYASLMTWLRQPPILHEDHSSQRLSQVLHDYLREQSIEPPSGPQTQRLIRSALRQFEDDWFQRVTSRLSSRAKLSLDALLDTPESEQAGYARSVIARLKVDAGKLGLKSLLQEVRRLEQLQQVELPDDLFEIGRAHV